MGRQVAYTELSGMGMSVIWLGLIMEMPPSQCLVLGNNLKAPFLGGGNNKCMSDNGVSLEKQLVAILQNHCGERGDNEGAVETLERIIKERDKALSLLKVK